ncbi:MAG TPA: hypothetical protein VMT18_11680, partial [Planctomycetota bacterium]|nr:hypothetical protein [Planctomycetota bacterium]
MREFHLRRQGSAARPLVLILVVLAVLVGGALWLLRDSEGGGAIGAGATPLAPRAEEPRHTELAGPAADEEPLRDVATPVVGGPSAAVRLTGEGRLSGRVLERESGEGVAGAEVELLPTPPIASEVIGRVLRLAALGEETAARVAVVARTVSGPDGSFAFERLRTGSYFAQARGPWHVPDAPVQARVTPADAGSGVEV